MLKMMTYKEANQVLGSSLSPNNRCICKKTALANGSDSNKMNLIMPNAANNRLVPASAVSRASVVTYTIVFKDWDGTIISTQYVQQGGTVTKPADPTRSGYTFSGWSPAFNPTATSNVEYTATYTESGSGTQYKIIFADKKVVASGIYIYMNDGSIVPISQKDTVSKTNAVGIAYISGNLKALIDTKNSQAVEFGRANDYPRESYNTGLEYTNFLRDNEDPQSPLPVLTWCDSRFNGEGYIPTISEWLQIAAYASQINTAMEWFGGDTFVTESNHPNQTYWSSNLYSDNRVNDLEFNAVGSDDNWNVIPIQLISNIYDRHYVRVLKNIDVPTPYKAEGIYQTMYVNAGVTPNPNTPTKEGYLFEGWNPNLYPADKDETYYAIWTESGSGESDPDLPHPIGTIYARDKRGNWIPSGGDLVININSFWVKWDTTDSGPTYYDMTASPGAAGLNGGPTPNTWGGAYVNQLPNSYAGTEFTALVSIYGSETNSYVFGASDRLKYGTGTWNVLWET